MVGYGLKKFAQENGLTVANGVAYGCLNGFNVTMSEGSNYKKISFATNFKDLAMKGAFTACVEGTDLYKKYRINSFTCNDKSITVVFYDTIGTMKKIRAFVDWFTDVLTQYEATTAGVCLHCGGVVSNGTWSMVDGICYYMHDTCADRMMNEVADYNNGQKETMTGTYIMGAVGAFAGAALGAAVWALVLMLGYVASIVGFVIGWLSQFGYNLLKGKQGKGKLAVLALAIIFGVLLGTIAADVFELVKMIDSGELLGATYSDIPEIMEWLWEDAEYRSTTLGNVAVGLLFAALGVLPMLKQTSDSVAGRKFKKM